MLGRVVVESQQDLLLLGDLGRRLGPLLGELFLKLLDGLLGVRLVLGLGYLADGPLGPFVHALR